MLPWFLVGWLVVNLPAFMDVDVVASFSSDACSCSASSLSSSNIISSSGHCMFIGWFTTGDSAAVLPS